MKEKRKKFYQWIKPWLKQGISRSSHPEKFLNKVFQKIVQSI